MTAREEVKMMGKCYVCEADVIGLPVCGCGAAQK